LAKQLWEISPDKRILSMAKMIALSLMSAAAGANLTLTLP
jgi:hypothetical protein